MYYIVDLGSFFNILGRERAYSGRGRLFTPHKVTTGYCLELYYWLHGSSHLVTKYRGEDYVEETMAVSRQVSRQQTREHVSMSVLCRWERVTFVFVYTVLATVVRDFGVADTFSLVLQYKMTFLIDYNTQNSPDSKVYRANMGLTWGRQDPGGPHVAPMNLASWVGIAINCCRANPGQTEAY